jgi:hypothetical protein
MKWRYKLKQHFELFAPEVIGVFFVNEWLRIEHGRIIIQPEYSWDGCSPTLKLQGWRFFPNGIWFGPWDGPLGKDARPTTWKATLIHDVLCQFREEIPDLKKDATVALFKRLLVENDSPFWISLIYPLAVDWFGPQEWGRVKRFV